MYTDELNQPEVLIFFLSGDKIVDLYDKIYIKNKTNLPFYIVQGQHSIISQNDIAKFSLDYDEVYDINTFTHSDKKKIFEKIISNFWMLIPEMNIKFVNGNLSVLSNKFILLEKKRKEIKEEGEKEEEEEEGEPKPKEEKNNHCYKIVFNKYINNEITNVNSTIEDPNSNEYYYSDNKLYDEKSSTEYSTIFKEDTTTPMLYMKNNQIVQNAQLIDYCFSGINCLKNSKAFQYFILPNLYKGDTDENIQSSFKTNQNVTCNITCKFINVDILQRDNIDKYTQLFTSGKITKVFIGDDFFDKENNNRILSNLLTEQKKLQNTPEVILLPCLQNKSSNNEINEISIAELNNKLDDIELNTKFNTEFNVDNNNCADTNFISIVLNKFYTTTINRIEENLGGKRRKSTKKTKKTRKPRKKSRKSRKHKKSRKH